ncbi:hypothetical protein RJ639_044868 [Escallonia herrerae]|uniref:Wall-associated receptor kinase C-terminal domain-containing protein n=1 Tax=Escallonia herrerae TaxID=1293975 RepID=A0AA89B168_9ASTE|nr:hypothetical protein RJ639_044868 [Escallonia herrerae]
MAGYVQDGQDEEALHVFLEMLAANLVKPNQGTFVSALGACSYITPIEPKGHKILQVKITPSSKVSSKLRIRADARGNATKESPKLDSSASMSMAKPGCQEKCGTWREDPPDASVLTFKSRSSISHISDKYVHIVGDPVSFCYSSSGTLGLTALSSYLVLTSSYSHVENKFVAIGCDIFAYIGDFGNTNYTTGYAVICDSTPPPVGYPLNISLDFTLFEQSLQVYTINTLHKYWEETVCSLAFTEAKTFTSFTNNNTVDLMMLNHIPAVLSWAIGNISFQEARKKEDYACGRYTSCVDSIRGHGYQCHCFEGYHGNAYL